MARMMARAGRRLLAETDLILPVPLHRFRLWRRRFNQSAFLAQRISQLPPRPGGMTSSFVRSAPVPRSGSTSRSAAGM